MSDNTSPAVVDRFDAYAYQLSVGDEIKSARGTTMTVTGVSKTSNRVVVLFDGDREIDFAHHDKIVGVVKRAAKRN